MLSESRIDGIGISNAIRLMLPMNTRKASASAKAPLLIGNVSV